MRRWIVFGPLLAVIAVIGSLWFAPGNPGRALAQTQAPADQATEAPAAGETIEGVNGGLIILPPDDVIIKFDEPITFGAVPVNGKSIAQLIEGVPEFPPIEGLDESLWKKTCANCHKWNKQTMCDQGKTYMGKNARMIVRLAHPYGAPFKLALQRWATQGCQ